MRMRIPSWSLMPIALMMMVALAIPSKGANKTKKLSPAAGQPTGELVWPLPPDLPRVRWLGEFSKFKDVEPPKKEKKSWFEKMAGVKEKKEENKGLTSPYGIAVDSEERIYVADWSSGGVLVFDRKGQTARVLGSELRLLLRMPLGLAVDGQNRLFVSDGVLHTITCLTSEGQVLAQFGRDELARPAGLALDDQRHRLYVADAKADHIAVFDTQSFEFRNYIGKKSTVSEPGTFRSPSGVAVDRQGNLYVTDTFNHRVQVFNPRGRFEREFGSHGNGAGQFSRPKGIAVDSEGHVYVADAEFNNFQVFDQEGKVLMFVGTLGTSRGQFTLITDLFIDSADRIYTTERYQPRVQIFQYVHQDEEAVKKEVPRRRKKQ